VIAATCGLLAGQQSSRAWVSCVLPRKRSPPAKPPPIPCATATPPTKPTGYQLEALEKAVPGLEELPPSFPLDRKKLYNLIKDNFRRHKAGVVELSEGYTTLDQGFAALRALSEQLYLEQCSSRSCEDNVLVSGPIYCNRPPPEHCALHLHRTLHLVGPLAPLVTHSSVTPASLHPRAHHQIEVTSSWMGTEQLPTGETKHAFTYRVRVTNGRDASIQVLGRSWDIMDASGALGESSLKSHYCVLGG